MQPITITSYNIHKGMSPLNRMVVMQGIADALKAVNPDILCLQEVQGQNLQRMVQYNEFPEQSQHEWFGEYLNFTPSYGKNAEYDNGHHGNAVLSRHPLDPMHNVNITVNKLEQRGILHCEVTPKGWNTAIVVLCAHLNLLESDRQKQYSTIEKYLQEEIDDKQPLIIAGDFNDWHKKSQLRLANDMGLTEAFMACHDKFLPTFPARLPMLCLDRIYVRNLKVHRAWVHKGKPWSGLSDHLPVSARISLI